MELQCTVCGVRACSSAPGASERPDFCPMVAEDTSIPSKGVLRRARAAYDDPVEGLGGIACCHVTPLVPVRSLEVLDVRCAHTSPAPSIERWSRRMQSLFIS